MSTTAASAAMRRTFRHSLFGFVLDPKSFPLTTNRTPKILELGFDCLVDGFTRPTKVFGNVISIVFRLLANLIARNSVPKLTAPFCSPACADGTGSCRLPPGPSGSPAHACNNGHDRPASGGPTSKHERQARPDRQPDQRGRQ